MTQRLSKILLALEALLLVVPITVLFATIASDLFFSFLHFSDAWQLGLFRSARVGDKVTNPYVGARGAQLNR